MAESEGFEPPIPVKVCRFSSSQADSDAFGKFSTLLYFSTAYKEHILIGHDSKCSVLSMKLLQFYYSIDQGVEGSSMNEQAILQQLVPDMKKDLSSFDY